MEKKTSQNSNPCYRTDDMRGFSLLSGLAILYRVDNKYTAKTEMVQEYVSLLPVSGTAFLVDGWEFTLTVCSRPGTFQFKLPLPVIRSGPGNIRTWPYSILTEISYGAATYRLRLKGRA